jgi:malate dehydrogenase (oxaloacetate-decarboxylating)
MLIWKLMKELMNNFDDKSLELHRKMRGKLGLDIKVSLDGREDLSSAYTPGVAAVSKAIADDPEEMYELTPKGNSVLVVSDGSAVLGLGNLGAAAAYPVMEGKCLLFKKFAGIDAYPLVVKTQDVSEIVELIYNVSDGFGGVNLEDIAAPRCFEIEEKLKERLDIPVFHDDQHGTAIVVLAGLINALKIVGKGKDVKVAVNGAGAAGLAVTELLLAYGFTDIVVGDSKGAIYEGRDGLSASKAQIAKKTNLRRVEGGLAEMMQGADVFIGVSRAGLVSGEMVASMAEKAIVFALANPDPEIGEDEAKAAGAAIVATGRSDCDNQMNNVLVFPGIFRGALDARIKHFDQSMFVKAAEGLASLVKEPGVEKFIPGVFDEGVAEAVAGSI